MNKEAFEPMTVKISAHIVKKQDEIIMQTIQQIGGTLYTNVTIDRDKVLEALSDYVKKSNRSADVVEVVRCKDCKYAEVIETQCGAKYIECQSHEVYMEADDYCSYGERKDAKDETEANRIHT